MTKDQLVSGAVLGAAVVAAAALLWLWFAHSGQPRIEERRPGADGADAADAASLAPPVVDIEGEFLRFDGTAGAEPGDWPWFRGPDHDNVSKEAVALASAWPRHGPPVLWSVELGEGYAGPAVHNGRVYVLDYDEARQADALRCFALGDGREIWRRSYRVPAKRNHGFSRTVPAVTDRHVVTVGPQCHVLCCDAVSGAFRWGLDLVRAEGATVPLWYTGQCPLIDGGRAILAPAGTNLLIGVDCDTGRVVWRAPNPRGWKMSHSSVVPMVVNGRKQYVYFAIGGIAGVAADGPEAGKILWESAQWAPTVVAPSPVPLDDGRLFLTVGYGGGSALLQLRQEHGALAAHELYRLPKTVFACEQHTPIFYRDHLWSILPKDAEARRGELACLRPDGTLAWTSGKAHRFGLGPFLVADGKLFVLSDTGVLTLAAADLGGYRPLAEAKVLEGREAWAPMALAGGRLLLRDERRMICLDVRQP